MTNGGKGAVSGIDLLQSDHRVQLASEYHLANQIVSRSNQTLTSLLDQTGLSKLSDRVLKNSVLKPTNYLFQFEQEKTDHNLAGVQSFDQIVRAVMGGYTLHPGASDEARRQHYN